NRLREADQADVHTEELLQTVNEGILKTEIEDADVFFHGRVLSAMLEVCCTSSTARLIAAIMLSARAMPMPAISKAVPWSGLVLGNGRPSVTFTPSWKACSFNGINP